MKIYFVESFAIVLVLTMVIVTGELRKGGRCTENKKKSPDGTFLPDLERDRDKFYTPGLNPYSRYGNLPRFKYLPFEPFEELRPFLSRGGRGGSTRCRQNKRKSPEGRFSPDLERVRDKFYTPGLIPYGRYIDPPTFSRLPFGTYKELRPFLRQRRSTQNKKKCPKGRLLQNLEGDRITFHAPCLNPYSRYTDVPEFHCLPFIRMKDLFPFLTRKVCTGQGKECPKDRFLEGPIGGRNRVDPPGINPDARFLHNPNANIPGRPSDILTPLPYSRFLQGPIGGRNKFDPPGINPDARFLHNPNAHVPGSPSDILTPLPDSRFLQGPIGGRNRFDPPGINPDARF